MSAARWTKLLTEVQAERLSCGCAACANFARGGMPVQCNYHRTNTPDRLTIAMALAAEFMGRPDPKCLALDVMGL